MIEFIVGMGLIFSGVLIGSTTQKELPEEWGQEGHIEMVRRCAISCGEERFQSYSSLTGSCKCRIDRQK